MLPPVSLAKGANVNLSKHNPGLRKIVLGLGWDPRVTTGDEWDLDASVFMLRATGRVIDNNGFIFYGKLTSDDGSIQHMGDDRTGSGEGDSEQIAIDLDMVPQDIHRLVIAVTIHEGIARRQNFGNVDNAFIRIVDASNEHELSRYDLTEDASTETAMIFGEVYRNGSDWKFKAVGQGFAGGLKPLAQHFGVGVQ